MLIFSMYFRVLIFVRIFDNFHILEFIILATFLMFGPKVPNHHSNLSLIA